MTNSEPSLGQALLGTEGLALLRLATGDDDARRARVSEIRSLVRRLDEDELSAPLPAHEYDVDSGYETWSENYDSPLRLFFIEEPSIHAVFDTLPAGALLDAACGTGRHSMTLARRGHRVVGVDRSAAMLARARDKLPDVDFREGDLTALPLETASVDAAVCALALVHLPELEKPVAELARVVRPGGRVIISDVHPFLLQLGWQAQFRLADGRAGFMRLHTHLLSAYGRAFADAGLRIRAFHEPLLTPQSAITVATDRYPEANHAAWVGLPGVVVWDLERSA